MRPPEVIISTIGSLMFLQRLTLQFNSYFLIGIFSKVPEYIYFRFKEPAQGADSSLDKPLFGFGHFLKLVTVVTKS
jgi:hypothetical protein